MRRRPPRSTLFSLHDALPIWRLRPQAFEALKATGGVPADEDYAPYIDRRLKRIIKKATAGQAAARFQSALEMRRALERIHFADRKSTRLNSSHPSISYAVFCL